MNKFLQWTALIGLSFGSFIFRINVLAKVWGYIAIPLGAKPLDFAHAYGLALLVALAMEPNSADKLKKGDGTAEENALKHIIYSFVGTLVSWGIAYWLFG